MSDKGNDRKGPPKLPPGGQPDIITPEVAEVLRQESVQQVNINVLLVRISEKTNTSDEVIAGAERVFELARKFEHQRVEDFKARADAIIDVKTRDPDEVEKRANNRTRRHLKYVLGGCSLGGLGGGIATVALGGPILVSGLLLLVGAMGVAMMGPLASGESVSSNDVVRILGAARSLIPGLASGEQNRSKRRQR